VPTKQIV
jgi:hypothetical protein